MLMHCLKPRSIRSFTQRIRFASIICEEFDRASLYYHYDGLSGTFDDSAKVEQVVEACKKAEERMKTYRTDEHGFIYTFVISQGEEEPYTKEYRYE